MASCHKVEDVESRATTVERGGNVSMSTQPTLVVDLVEVVASH
jgi:hypothetical protein